MSTLRVLLSFTILSINCFCFAQEARINSVSLLTTTRILSSDAFEGRKTDTKGGWMARDYIVGQFKEIGLIPLDSTYVQTFQFYYRLYNVKPTGHNIIGYIEGTEIKDPNKGCIVVGAHYDHLGMYAGDIYNGADDNASGVATLLEIAKELKHQPASLPVVFISFDAEEMRCAGSNYFVNSPLLDNEAIHLFINMDMISKSDEEKLFVTGTNFHPEYKKYINATLEYCNLSIKYGHDRKRDDGLNNWVFLSDHGEFHKKGIPFIYFGVEEHQHYHRPTDTFENIDIGFFVEASNVVLSFVKSVANKKSLLKESRRLN
ncbi:M20/M25/M40 family metallo-hydrolase [Flammeovirga aprica]|uniref:M20/M25/M40 family metallo-hydrolase n=1 Tax=Flammeovirga aprica JL-4 TaxID=694437 RepID=A0A7X9RW39_9BACT|nr:M20/M25/M40 family metallo-hydrolase [Flammeovirga aprica]NME69729.1 M20/M25/M40 family metallo-hydrolase [Flammeovirga aprica JL-4]